MRNGFDQAEIDRKRIFDEFLAIARDRAARDADAAAAGSVERSKLLAHDLYGIAPIGGIICIQKFAVLGDERELCGCASAVDAQPRTARVGLDRAPPHGIFFVPCADAP